MIIAAFKCFEIKKTNLDDTHMHDAQFILFLTIVPPPPFTLKWLFYFHLKSGHPYPTSCVTSFLNVP